jgi:hypothetical protein
VTAEVRLFLGEQFAMAFTPPADLEVRADGVDRAADRAGA